MNNKSKKLAKKLKNNLIKSKSDEKIAKCKRNLNIENVISSKKYQITLIITFIILFLLIIRLFYLQTINGPYLASLASKQQTTSEKINSKRGNIYDSTGASLAISETVDTITINPLKIKAKNDEDTPELKEKIARGLSEIFELDYDKVLQKVQSSSSTETIIKKVEEDKVNKLKNWMKENSIKTGINIDEDAKRYYPYSTLASQVIGVCRKR